MCPVIQPTAGQPPSAPPGTTPTLLPHAHGAALAQRPDSGQRRLCPWPHSSPPTRLLLPPWSEDDLEEPTTVSRFFSGQALLFFWIRILSSSYAFFKYHRPPSPTWPCSASPSPSRSSPHGSGSKINSGMRSSWWVPGDANIALGHRRITHRSHPLIGRFRSSLFATTTIFCLFG